MASTFRQRTRAAPQDAISIPIADVEEPNHSFPGKIDRKRRRLKSCSVSVLGLILVLISIAQATRSHLRRRELHKKLAAISRRTVVSIGTVPSRRNDLLKTLDSLFHQTFPPSRVQIHYSSESYHDDNSGADDNHNVNETDESYPDLGGVIREAGRLLEYAQPNNQRDPRMRTQVTFHAADPSWRSATKLLGFLRQEWGGTSPPSPNQPGEDNQEEPLVIVADDDFQYLPTWLESLLVGHLLFPDSAVALRGWRVRKDLRYGAPSVGSLPHPDGVWGSFPAVERYVIRGANIVEPYRVGVVTGVNGILFRQSFFGSEVFDAPSPDYLSVDDIWYSGILANRSVQRWVVPFIGSGNRDRDVGNHLGGGQTVIDGKLKSFNRGRANQMVIKYFAKAWERGDGASLFWSHESTVQPKLRGLLPFRHWFSEHIILWVYQWYSFGKFH